MEYIDHRSDKKKLKKTDFSWVYNIVRVPIRIHIKLRHMDESE